jgi:hypothetical protein
VPDESFARSPQYYESTPKIVENLPSIIRAAALTSEDVLNVMGGFSKITEATALIIAKVGTIIAVALVTFGELPMTLGKSPKTF